MRFCDIADARNAVFCRTKRVSADVWGSLSGGRVQNRLGPTGIMVGSVAQSTCRFRRHFPKFNFQNMKDVSKESFVFTYSTVGS